MQNPTSSIKPCVYVYVCDIIYSVSISSNLSSLIPPSLSFLSSYLIYLLSLPHSLFQSFLQTAIWIIFEKNHSLSFVLSLSLHSILPGIPCPNFNRKKPLLNLLIYILYHLLCEIYPEIPQAQLTTIFSKYPWPLFIQLLHRRIISMCM